MMESSINRRMVTRSKVSEETDTTLIKDATKRSAENLPDFQNKKRILGDITNQAGVNNLKTTIIPWKNKTIKLEENSVPHNEQFHKESIKEEIFTSEEPLEDSVYVTALDENSIFTQKKSQEKKLAKQLPEGVEDFDKTCAKDQFSESRYASDVFNYYLQREKKFPVKKYLKDQTEVTRRMRAILVDWMVEVQESFELNHETLYLGVKLVDLYLMKNFVPKSDLQLVGVTAICIAAKYDERQPPLIDDFLYICDDSYSRDQLIRTEVKILQTVDFDLGIPLSYRFLRRFARCSKLSMELLTLARYILETALMDYDLIEVLDSKLAAASLLLALKMKQEKWTPTHEYYSGYKEIELMNLVGSLNKNIAAPASSHLQTIRIKYSHQVFFGVSKIPPLAL